MPGSLLLRETGGVTRLRDGRDYRAGDVGPGLIGAGTEQIWRMASPALSV